MGRCAWGRWHVVPVGAAGRQLCWGLRLWEVGVEAPQGGVAA